MRFMFTDSHVKMNAQISQEAAEWFVEFRTSDVDMAARTAFDAWIRSSPEHLRAYLEVAAIWDEGCALDAQRAFDVDALVALARGEDKVVQLADVREHSFSDSTSGQVLAESGRRAATAVRPKKARYWSIAACMAFLAATAGTFAWLQFYAAQTYATHVGEQRSIRLSDGSTVSLNSRSRVRVAFNEAERSVELLEGQALFEVSKDPARPFVVRSAEARVRAIGTQFDVNRKSSGTVVTVVEGTVSVLMEPDVFDPNSRVPQSTASAQDAGDAGGAGIPSLHAAIVLSAGEQVKVSAQAAPSPARVNVAAAIAWTQRHLVLESVALSEVAEEFNRYSTRKLVVEDSASNELRLSGVFVTDPDFLIRYLKERPDVTVHETDSEVRIIRREQK